MRFGISLTSWMSPKILRIRFIGVGLVASDARAEVAINVSSPFRVCRFGAHKDAKRPQAHENPMNRSLSRQIIPEPSFVRQVRANLSCLEASGVGARYKQRCWTCQTAAHGFATDDTALPRTLCEADDTLPAPSLAARSHARRTCGLCRCDRL